MKCPRCNASVNQSTLCDKCRVAYGEKYCQCGTVIHRDDRMCRMCWTSISENRPNRANGFAYQHNAFSASDVTMTDLDNYRMETTSVGMISAEDDGEFYMGLISDQAREGLEKWRQKKAQS